MLGAHNSNNIHHHNHHHHGGQYPMVNPNNKVMSKQLMNFQSYVRTLNNNVDENTACKKYKDFMADLSQSKVGRFFDANKDRDWFKLKYHPIESLKYLQQQNVNFLKRLKIFTDLNDKHYFDSLSCTANNSSRILNLMDAIIIILEDGPQELVEQLLTSCDEKIGSQQREKYVPLSSHSVVIDDISIETTLSEIQDICLKASPELLRIAQLDPYYVEGGCLRRKVVAIYKTGVDVKEVCWKLSRLRLNNRALSVSINKCLTNRIMTVDAISNHHICIVNDIRNAIVLILNFDELKGLYGKRKQLLENSIPESMEGTKASVKMELDESIVETNGELMDTTAPPSPPGSVKSHNDDEEEKPFDVSSLDEDKEKEKKKVFEFKFDTDMSQHQIVNKLSKNKNPILQDAHLYLVEYSESTAAVYFQSRVPKEVQSEPVIMDLDNLDSDRFAILEQIVKNLPCSLEESSIYLDRLLWYLRIVHSFDFYKKTIYRLEDDLTLRMSVIHLRDNPERIDTDNCIDAVKDYLRKDERDFQEFGLTQAQKYVTKDEERFNYKSYGKVITDELASYSQRIQKPKSHETEEVYKCKHCTRGFQKLSDIGRHFVGKHRWAIDAIELETDFFNAYLFDCNKINPCPPKELLEIAPNRFARLATFSQMGEDPDLLQQTIEAYSKMESYVREPAPRTQVESDPRNESIVDYADVSFDDAI